MSSFADQVTPLILTLNEEPNIGRTLDRLRWAIEIVVVDSFSTDKTPEMARASPRVRFCQRQFDTHTQQWNFGLEMIRTPWVLSLDADYMLPPRFESELRALDPGNAAAFFTRFRYCVFGHRLRGALYPPRAVLFRRDRCAYREDGHTQKLEIRGTSAFLVSVIDHDDRKPLADWLKAQNSYTRLEAAKLATTPAALLSLSDRIRLRVVLAPWLLPLYALLIKGLIFDGWPGWYYVMQRTYAELLLSLHLADGRLRSLDSRDTT